MASTSQEFDALDGLVITGDLNVGGGATFDTNVLVIDATNNRVGINKTPTVAFDVSGDVNIDGGTIDGLTQLNVDNITLNNHTIESSTLLILKSGPTAAIDLDSGTGAVRLEKSSTEYGRLLENNGDLIIAAGSSTTSALRLQSDGDAVFQANALFSDGNMLKLGSVQIITGSATGARFSANTTHNGHIVADGDTNTHLNFNAADSFQITTGGVVRMTVDNSGVDIGTLVASATLSETAVFETVQTEATYNIDIGDGSAVLCTATGGGTVAFTMPSNLPSNSFSWTVKFNNSGTITWPASVEWAEGVVPPVSAGTDIYSFVTYDGGTTIYGSLAIRNAS
jgi:hypothetical protein